MDEHDREAVRQWLAKAQSDWDAVEILTASERCPNDTVCFHCQQFVEKMLKALLTKNEIEAPKTHDLRRLIQLAQPFAKELSLLADVSDELTIHGVETRYPGELRKIKKSEMIKVVELAKRFGDILHAKTKE
ncbi:MAG: HEPN domain-containing protein [Sedimentisphaerales bacterium]|nr:HEPN domain-containing protein [Sedimentisphaerales bacterium]